MQHKRLIPFRWLPASWGLVGKAFDEAEAYYLYKGEDLERRLLYIRHADAGTHHPLDEAVLALDLKYARITPYEHDCRLLALRGQAENVRSKAEIELRHGRIDQYAFDLLMAQQRDPAEQPRAILDLKLHHGLLSKPVYDKAVATLEEKPWIGIIDQGFDPEQGVNGVYFEFDWNSYWVEYLRLNGYVGHSEEALVERWFEDVCRATAEANPPSGPNGIAAPLPFSAHLRGSTRVRGNDGTFYS
jgi:hypothetical protein